MRKGLLFIVIILVSAAGYLLTALWHTIQTTPQPSQDSVRGMMDMVNMMSGAMFSPSQGLLTWTLTLAFTASLIAGIAGFAYFLIYPEIRTSEPKTLAGSTSLEAVFKTLNEEEKKVVEVLLKHGGTYLQKYVWKEAGLSRLKVHRIVSRFAERGLLTVRPSGNTNELVLAEWLKSGKERESE